MPATGASGRGLGSSASATCTRQSAIATIVAPFRAEVKSHCRMGCAPAALGGAVNQPTPSRTAREATKRPGLLAIAARGPLTLCALRRSAVSSALALASLSWVPLPEAAPTSSEPVAGGSLAPIDECALEGEVVVVRRLLLAHPIDVRVLSDGDFRGYVGSRTRLGRLGSGSRNAFCETFGLGALDRPPGATERRVLEAEVVGFYDPRAEALLVRGSTGDPGPHELASRLRGRPHVLILATWPGLASGYVCAPPESPLRLRKSFLTAMPTSCGISASDWVQPRRRTPSATDVGSIVYRDTSR
jgi:hypothetical protein